MTYEMPKEQRRYRSDEKPWSRNKLGIRGICETKTNSNGKDYHYYRAQVTHRVKTFPHSPEGLEDAKKWRREVRSELYGDSSTTPPVKKKPKSYMKKAQTNTGIIGVSKIKRKVPGKTYTYYQARIDNKGKTFPYTEEGMKAAIVWRQGHFYSESDEEHLAKWDVEPTELEYNEADIFA